ncbi:general secretion pathway protein H [Rhodoblastus sphagnicola]|uniref:prepilin-type N-terminal cleavage/methylation domain-containing protein n=1 Tax=Rhodoblastus sphagnicola TaxID=333368 RepID=UPI0017C12A49|nr:GspH/FimT family pseudopilin [Rhodoblastus sphagnicola]MBB4196397.1 general secretion pathway protein H [Rhodoblastus sphagnicola]
MKHRRAEKRRAGFSLLEMLAALTIIALAGAFAAQVLRPKSPRLRLEVAARALCATLRAAQARALATQTPAFVSIDVNARSYASSVGGLGRLPADASVTLTLAKDEAGAGQGAIKFFPGGGASGGDIALTLEGRAAKISVNWLTGGATCVYQ